MTLTFRLLVVDDDTVELQAVESLRQHLRGEGFSLEVTAPIDLSQGHLTALAKREGQEFDLVIVDYRLRPGYKGHQVLADFRRKMKFTEMVFYTADPLANLYQMVADAEIDGVFVARRDDDLDEVLRGVADIVIGKAMDLNHMRGIAMAEVAEIDVVMGSTIGGVLGGSGAGVPRAVAEDLEKTYLEARARRDYEVAKMLRREGFRGVVEKGVMFSSQDRWKAIRTLAELVSEVSPKQVEKVRNYQKEVLERRNKLAHMGVVCTEDGSAVLKSDDRAGSKETDINEKWMRSFRLKLRAHRDAMQAVCRAIDAQFGGMGGSEKSKKP